MPQRTWDKGYDVVNETLRDIRSLLPVVVVAALFAFVMLFIASEGGVRIWVVVLGLAAIAIGAYLSGNVRLFSLWGLILTLPFDLSYRLGPVYQKLGGETSFRIEVSDPFWLVLLAYLARDLWTGTLRGVRIPKVTYWWLAIMMMGMGAVTFGPWRLTALHEVVRMVKVMLIFIVVCNELKTPERFIQVAAALCVALIIQSMAGIAQFVTGGPLGLRILGEADVVLTNVAVRSASVMRIGAFMVHPVLFAIFLATILPIAMGMVLLPLGKGRRLLFIVTILLGVPSLILTLSRAGWLDFSVSSTVLAVLILLHPRLRRRAVIPVVGIGAVLVVVAAAFAGPIMARIYDSTSYSAQGRDEWRRDALRLVEVKPIFGWGLNSYVFAVPPFTRFGARGARELYEKARFGGAQFVPAVHNGYLTWLAEIGIVGLALHLAMFASLILTGFRNMRVRNEYLYVINVACIASLFAILVDLNFANALRQGSILREFWVLAALICGVHYWRLRNEPQVQRPVAAKPASPVGDAAAGK